MKKDIVKEQVLQYIDEVESYHCLCHHVQISHLAFFRKKKNNKKGEEELDGGKKNKKQPR